MRIILFPLKTNVNLTALFNVLRPHLNNIGKWNAWNLNNICKQSNSQICF